MADITNKQQPKKSKKDSSLLPNDIQMKSSEEVEDEATKALKSKTFVLNKDLIALSKLGKGTYGTVYKVQNKKTGAYYAVKKIKMDVDTEGIPSTALREIAILKKMNHPNIVNIVELAFSDKNIELCLEYCEYDLKKFIENYKTDNSVYNLRTIKSLMFQIIKATDYLHSHKVLHRDLKPQNVLVNQKCIAKLADFGLSRVYSIPIRPYTKEVLTLWYRSPEMILGMSNYSIGLDIWSLGCIFGELFTTKPMFAGDCELDQLYQIFRVFGTFNEQMLPGYKSYPYFHSEFPYWKGCGLQSFMVQHAKISLDSAAFDLLEKMLVIQPDKRISCREALSHPFFNDVICPLNYAEFESSE